MLWHQLLIFRAKSKDVFIFTLLQSLCDRRIFIFFSNKVGKGININLSFDKCMDCDASTVLETAHYDGIQAEMYGVHFWQYDRPIITFHFQMNDKFSFKFEHSKYCTWMWHLICNNVFLFVSIKFAKQLYRKTYINRQDMWLLILKFGGFSHPKQSYNSDDCLFFPL